MSEDLKPCPFDCKEKPYVHEVAYSDGKEVVWCTNSKCPIHGIRIDVAAWNTRPSGWIRVEDGLPQPTENTHPKQSEIVYLLVSNIISVEAYYDHYRGRWVDEYGKPVTGTHWQKRTLPKQENEI